MTLRIGQRHSGWRRLRSRIRFLEAFLEERKRLIKERLVHRLVKYAEEGSFRAHADVDICARGHAWLWVRDGGGGRGEVG